MAKTKILLVDDEPDFREIIGLIIEGWGYELIEASSGKEAIAAITNKIPHIVVLDYLMPVMDGVATLKKIREIDKEIPVIMFTAHPDIEAIEGTEKLGVFAFIPKLSVYSDAQGALKEALHMAEKRLGKKE